VVESAVRGGKKSAHHYGLPGLGSFLLITSSIDSDAIVTHASFRELSQSSFSVPVRASL
jgi:hypothetical protein